MRHTQTVEFAVLQRNGVVERVGKGSILQPKTEFKPKSGIKWHEDRKKPDGR